MKARPAGNEQKSVIHPNLANSRLKELLESKSIDPNQRNQGGTNGLNMTIKYARPLRNERITLLLQHGTDINGQQTEGFKNTALHTFVANEETNTVMYLITEAERLDKAINYNLRDFEGKTTLIFAAKIRNQAMALFILEHALKQKDFNINIADQDGMTALHYACALGMPRLAAHLIASGANINLENKKKRTPVDCTALGSDDIKAILSSAYIDPDRDEMAIQNMIGDANKQEFYIGSNSTLITVDDIPARTQSKHLLEDALQQCLINSELLFKFSTGEIQAQNPAEYLANHPLTQQQKQNIRDYFNSFTGISVLEAVLRERLIAQEVLIKYGASYSWLLRSYAANNIPQIQVLLRLDDIDQFINNHGTPSLKTAMHFAAEKNHLSVCKALLTAGASLNTSDKDDHTPLHLACLAGRAEMAIWLVRNGADVAKKNKQGKSIFNILADKGLHELSQDIAKQLNTSEQKQADTLSMQRI